MTVRFLLDTSTISSPVAKAPNAGILRRLEAHAHECAIAAPVWHELSYGCERMPAGKRREAIQVFLEQVVLRSFPVLPYDEASAHWHGRERARLERLGKPAPFVDGQIASIARVNDLTLVTSNTKDFRAFKELVVVNWSKELRV